MLENTCVFTNALIHILEDLSYRCLSSYLAEIQKRIEKYYLTQMHELNSYRKALGSLKKGI